MKKQKPIILKDFKWPVGMIDLAEAVRDPEKYRVKEANKEIINSLRQEAIEWIQILKKQNPHEILRISFEGKSHPFTQFLNLKTENFNEVIAWIKHFFEISDQDLKSRKKPK